MKVYTSLRELSYDLPNGFHDSELESLTINYTSNSAELDLELWIGDLGAASEEEREARKRARLHLNDLVYFVIDPPSLGHQTPKAGTLWIHDEGDASEESDREELKPKADLPPDAFAYWFFIDDWNSFMHIAAKGASLEWL